MVGPGVGGGGRHPAEVGEDVFLCLELLPVGCLVCAEDGGVVLCLQPVAALVRGYWEDVLLPLFEWL